MPKYGVHGFLLEGSWDNQIAPKVIAEVAELGFDFDCGLFMETFPSDSTMFPAPLLASHSSPLHVNPCLWPGFRGTFFYNLSLDHILGFNSLLYLDASFPNTELPAIEGGGAWRNEN